MSGNQYHPLIQAIVEIEWEGDEPTFLRDRAAEGHPQEKRYRVLEVSEGLILIEPASSGSADLDITWIPLSKIVAIRLSKHAGNRQVD